MAISFGDNLDYAGKKPDFVRQEYAAFAEMKAVKKSNMPELYFAYCLEDRNFYKYDKSLDPDPITGNFRLFQSGSGGSDVQMDEMPTPGEEWVDKIVQYIGEDSGNFKRGFFYIGTATDHYEELPIEDVAKMKEQVALNGEQVTLRTQFGEEYNTKALVKDGVYYFVQEDTVFSGTKVDIVVNTLEELNTLIGKAEGTITLETPNGTRHQLQAWPYNNKWYFIFNTITYQGINVDDVLKSRAELWTMVSTSEDRITVDYGEGITEERPAYLFNGNAYFILTGQLYGGTIVNNTVFYPDARALPNDTAVEAEHIVLGQIVYLADSTAIATDEQVVALDLVMRQVIDYDPGVNPKYTADEQIAAIGLTWIWNERTYQWEMQQVSPSEGEPESIPNSEIDALFD